jgi:hypothetical protein
VHLAIHPARSGVPAHSKALMGHHGEIIEKPKRDFRRAHIPEYVPPHKRRYVPVEEKFALMRERMARLKAKGMLA